MSAPPVQHGAAAAKPCWVDETPVGNPLARFVLTLLTYELGSGSDGIQDVPHSIEWLMEDTEMTEAQVRRALRHLCRVGALEWCDVVTIDEFRPDYVTGWRLTRRPPIVYVPRVLTPLERMRAQFKTCAGRRDLRAGIEDGRHVCAYCGSTDELQVDHIVPLKHGGTNDRSNLQVLCRSCNNAKGAKV